MRWFLSIVAALTAAMLKFVIGLQLVVLALAAAVALWGWPDNWQWPSNDPLGASTERLHSALNSRSRTTVDPIVSALSRDRERLDQFARGLTQPDRHAWVDAVAASMASELDVDAVYVSQTGPLDYFYRDTQFLRVEALVRGVTPARVQVAELRQQTEDLKRGADQALELSYQLETPEALDLLARHLWNDDRLIQSGRLDPRTYSVIADVVRQWGPEAVTAINDLSESQATWSMRASYLAAIRSKLHNLDGPYSGAISTGFNVPRVLERNYTFTDREHALYSMRGCAQVPAIAIAAIADNRLVVLGIMDGLATRLSGHAAQEFVESFQGVYDLPRSLWSYARDGQDTLIRERLRETVFDPADLSRSMSQIHERMVGLPRLVNARLLDEAERGSLGRLPQVSGIAGTYAPPSVNGDAITDQMLTRAAFVATDISLVAAEIAISAGLVATPDPTFVTKVIGVIGAMWAVADMAWESTKAYPSWQQMASVRIALTSGVTGLLVGVPPHPQCVLDAGTVVTPGGERTDGSVLQTELALWRQLRAQATQGEAG